MAQNISVDRAAFPVGRQELVIQRTFYAPREAVWKAWTEPERLTQWWGPKGFTMPFCKMDFQVDGTYLNCMRSPEGEDFWGTGTYIEIVEKERLVFTDSFADRDGNIVPASTYGIQVEWPSELLISVTFDDINGATCLTLKYSGVPVGEDGDLTEQGLNESLDRLAECLK